MARIKHAIYTATVLVSVVLGTFVAAQPASAASWTWYNAPGGRPVHMGLFHTGKHVAKATVEMIAPLPPTRLTVRFRGRHADGTPTGPWKSYTWTCNQSGCAHTWTINFTYVAGNYVSGSAVVSGVIEGVATHRF